jgi:hypothetical protein
LIEWYRGRTGYRNQLSVGFTALLKIDPKRYEKPTDAYA